MHEHFGHPEHEENHARQSAREFERRLQNHELYFIDLMKVNEIFQYYLNSNEFGKARDLVHFAIQTHPTSSDLYHKQARLDFELGNFEEALAQIDQALHYSPASAEYLCIKADLLARLDQYEEAIEILEERLVLADEPALILLQMGNVAQICSKSVESERFYRSALIEDPQCEDALYELAFLMESLDRHEDGIKLYQDFLEDHPYTHLAWYNLAMLQVKQGDKAAALEALDFAIVVDETFHSAHDAKGQILLGNNEYGEALKAYLTSQSLTGKADIHTLYHIAECYENLDMFHDAIRYYHKVAENDPDYIDAWTGLGFCLERSEKYLEAIHYYQKALQLDRDNPDVCLSLAICEFKLGNRHSAYSYLEHAISLQPNDLMLWQDWAQLMYQQDNFLGAITFLEEGIKINPDGAELYYLCAAYALEAGMKHKGLMYLENGLLLDPAKRDILFQTYPELKNDKLIQRLVSQFIN
ncbi:MAG: tetratricopeptide repeat protein [Bacteroidota bacterium]